MAADETYNIVLQARVEGDAELKALSAQLQSLQGDASRSVESFDAMATALEGLKKTADFATEIFALEKLVDVVKEVGDAFMETLDSMASLVAMSQKLGISTENLSVLRLAAEETGVNFDQLAKGAVILTKNMEDLAGKNGPATQTLRAMGITAQTELFPALEKVADQFVQLPNGARKTALAVQEFGRAGADLIPLLNLGAAGIKEMAEEADKLGIIIGQGAAEQAKQLENNLGKLKLMVEGLKIALVTELTPALLALTEVFIDSTLKSGDLKVGVGGLGDALIAFSIDAVQALGGVEKAFNSAAASASGYGTIAKAAMTLAADAALVVAQPTRINETIGDAVKAAAAIKQGLKDLAAMDAANAAIDASTAATIKKIQDAYAAAKAHQPAPATGTDDSDIGGEGAASKAAAKAAKAAATEAAKAEKVRVELSNQLIETENKLTSSDMAGVKSNQASTMAKFTGDVAKGNDALRAQGAALNALVDPLDAYERSLADIGILKDKQYVQDDAAALQLAKTSADYVNAAEAMGLLTDASGKNSAAQVDTAGAMQKAYQGVADSIASVTEGLVAGTMKANQAVQTLLASLLKVAAESILTKLFAGSSKGSFGDLLVKSFSASGNVYGPAGVIPFANGGVVGGPTLFPFANGIGLMGEAGPEAVMPLQRDASGKLGVAAPAVNVTVHNNAGAAISVQQDGNNIDVIVARAVEASRGAVARDVQRGGTPISRAIERTYGTNRSAGAY